MQPRGRPLVVVSVAPAFLLAWGAESPPDAPSLNVPPGFSIELVAGPDLVSYPMFAVQDEEGRLYVSESTEPNVMTTEEMAASPSYRVRVLEDRDGDGVFDHSHVFADKIAFPQGGVIADGALYVSAAPDLLRLEDTDGDGVADKRDVLLTGWTLSVNGALLHGPFRGPDGWLYLTDARRSYSIETREGELLEGKGGRIWRCRPDGTGLEVVSAGGFDNPVEIVFTPAGETLGTMTFFVDPQAGLRDALMHWVEGGVYPKPHQVIEDDRLQRTGDLMPVMTKFANVAPSGLLRYRGDSLGPKYAGNLFSAQFNTHRVMRHVLSREGATFRTVDEEFLTSDGPNFHPTDVFQDADGSLLILDTGGWFLKGCPLSRVARPEYRGGIYRIRALDAEVPDDPRGLSLPLGTLAPTELAALLDDPRPAVRDRVVERLVGRGDDAVGALSQVRATHDAPEVRASAVFALFRIGSPEALRGVRLALGDEAAEVRVAAARAAGMARDPVAVDQLETMLLDEHPAVRRQAGTALAQIGDRSVVESVLAALAEPGDRFVEHALVYGLIRLAEADRVAAGLSHSSPSVRKGALIALDQMEAGPLEERQLLPLLGAEDPDLRRTALQVASRHLEWAAGISAFLESRLTAEAISQGELVALDDALLGLCTAPEVQAGIARLLGNEDAPGDRKVSLLKTLVACPVKEFPEAWIEPLRRQLQVRQPAVQAEAVQVVRTRELPQFAKELEAIASSSTVEPSLRVAALDALNRSEPELSDDRFGFLFEQLRSPDASLRQLAASTLGRARLSDSQLLRVAADSLSDADLLLVPSLLDAFRRGTNEEVGKALVASLADLAPVLDGLGAEGLTDLLSTYPDSVRSAAQPLLARLEELKGNRLQRLEGLLARLEPGDASRGRDLFFGAKVSCSSCHTVGSEGGRVGPDLTAIGAIRSRHDLLEAIMFPSASFVREFESVRVETEWDVHAGIIDERTPEALVLVTGADYRVRIPRADVVSMAPSPVSMMPEGLHEALTVAELSDLMTFLQALGQSAPSGIRYSSLKTEEPQRIHWLDVEPVQVELDVAVAGRQVLGKETPSSMARRKGADAAVNGGFFVVRGPFAGDFEGLFMWDGRLVSEPVHQRSSFAFCADGRIWIDQFELTTEVSVGSTLVTVDGLNRQRSNAETVVYSPAFGSATLNQGPEVVVENGAILGTSDGGSAIPEGGFVLALAEPLPQAGPGLEVHLEHRLTGRSSGALTDRAGCSIVSAGPTLIRDGQVLDDYEAESSKFVPSFSLKRHPRTAVGLREDGSLIFVVVDGRQEGLSVGMTLPELTAFLKEQGAHDAYNLDGGGSSTMIVNGEIMNSPSDATGERPSSDAILLRAH